MLKKLIEFFKNNYSDVDVNAYLDAKYIRINNTQLQHIKQILDSKYLIQRPASSCFANHFIFHFEDILLLLQKDTTNSNVIYQVELSWQANLSSDSLKKHKTQDFYFINFEFDDDYNTSLKSTKKLSLYQINNPVKNQHIVDKVMPILKGFISAIANKYN